MMLNKSQCDFEGWATRNDIRCGDGRIIRRDAFKAQDGMVVPLVWNHQHNDPMNVLGHALLENRDEGVYSYGFFNETELGNTAKLQVQHGDLTNLSIYANRLKQNGSEVVHGVIRELSLVLAGANPGAYITSVMEHSDEGDSEAIVIVNDDDISLRHSKIQNEPKKEEQPMPIFDEPNPIQHGEKTVGDVIDSMTEEQRNVLYALIGQAVDGASNYKEDDSVKHNAFDNDETVQKDVLSHSDIEAIFDTARKGNSLRDVATDYFEQKGIDGLYMKHGIEDIESLFPEPRALNNPPEWIRRDDGWVAGVMSSVHKSPFSRIKSSYANLTEDEARAKGYIKGKYKKEQVFSLLKRSTSPVTIYKKQKLDRDDVVDITDFDVVAWIRQEMRFMLNEELARAFLIGDGRLASDDDHISEDHIRPIWKDEDLFTIKQRLTVPSKFTPEQRAKAYIKAAIRARKGYRGSGNPTFYTTEDILTDMLLIEDTNGRVIYDSVSKLATMLRVDKIVTIPVFEDQKRNVDGTEWNLIGLIVNLRDYNVGADKGGEVNMFDDFDIDYNQMKYLIETRCSGALTKPFSAIAMEYILSGSATTVTENLSTMADGLRPYKQAPETSGQSTMADGLRPYKQAPETSGQSTDSSATL